MASQSYRRGTLPYTQPQVIVLMTRSCPQAVIEPLHARFCGRLVGVVFCRRRLRRVPQLEFSKAILSPGRWRLLIGRRAASLWLRILLPKCLGTYVPKHLCIRRITLFTYQHRLLHVSSSCIPIANKQSDICFPVWTYTGFSSHSFGNHVAPGSPVTGQSHSLF